jgi:hypothetical protein
MRLDDLGRLAADLASAGTAGYKTERTSTEEARRSLEQSNVSVVEPVAVMTEVSRALKRCRRESRCMNDIDGRVITELLCR